MEDLKKFIENTGEVMIDFVTIVMALIAKGIITDEEFKTYREKALKLVEEKNNKKGE